MADDRGHVPNGVPTNEGNGDLVPDNDVTENELDNNDNDQDDDDVVDCTGDTLQEPQEPPTPPTLNLPDEGDMMPGTPFIPLRTVAFIHPSKGMKEATFNFDLINLGYKTFEVST